MALLSKYSSSFPFLFLPNNLLIKLLKLVKWICFRGSTSSTKCHFYQILWKMKFVIKINKKHRLILSWNQLIKHQSIHTFRFYCRLYYRSINKRSDKQFHIQTNKQWNPPRVFLFYLSFFRHRLVKDFKLAWILYLKQTNNQSWMKWNEEKQQQQQ